MANNSDLNNFYYDILNIGKTARTNDLATIVNVTNENKKELGSISNDLSGLCKVAANNISVMLKNKGIACNVLNTKEILGGYEHVFVVAYYKETNIIKYVLIDPAYEQFQKKDNHVLSSAFSYWPSSVLQKTEIGSRLLSDLLNHGYSVINPCDINIYLGSFINETDIYKINFNLDDILIDKVRSK